MGRGMKEDTEGKGTRFPTTPNLLKQKRAGAQEETSPRAGRSRPGPENSRASGLLGITGVLPSPSCLEINRRRGRVGRESAQLPCPRVCPAEGVDTHVGDASAATPIPLPLYFPNPTRDLEECDGP